MFELREGYPVFITNRREYDELHRQMNAQRTRRDKALEKGDREMFEDATYMIERLQHNIERLLS